MAVSKWRGRRPKTAGVALLMAASQITVPLGAIQGDEVFRPSVTDELPDAARRFLLRSIAPGAPLASSVELEMHGTMRLAPDRDPLPIRAEQILAPPEEFVWSARTRGGLMRIRGFDRYGHGTGEMRWKLRGLVPVMRATGSDVTRSAAGRLAMESVLLPSTLVPDRDVTWEPMDNASARFRVSVGNKTVTTTLDVDSEGCPVRASAMRWSEVGRRRPRLRTLRRRVCRRTRRRGVHDSISGHGGRAPRTGGRVPLLRRDIGSGRVPLKENGLCSRYWVARRATPAPSETQVPTSSPRHPSRVLPITTARFICWILISPP